ncbi:MAG: hypothetical protein HFF89_03575 [Oscillibacter sp.]|jgi:hypothetical protein|nr:hypothetical protein [Oscillibacter sp.]MCI8848592.1 hypothetical protein [Oscillibacter sp.]
MALADVLSASGLGGIQKAFLIIHKFGAEAVNSAQAMQSATQAAARALQAAGNLSAVSSAVGAGMAHVMQVQYNPSSLALQANAESIPFTYLQQNADQGIPNQNVRPPMVVLSVELIFDAMNPQDAFMMDKARLSAGTVVSTAAWARGTKYTVQPQTDGLIAALLRPSTRLVTFRWADMAFTGQMIEVQADYTMFSVSGQPVRSKVRMNIAQQVESEADVQYWETALDNIFQNRSDIVSKTAAQGLGNLLNLDSF